MQSFPFLLSLCLIFVITLYGANIPYFFTNQYFFMFYIIQLSDYYPVICLLIHVLFHCLNFCFAAHYNEFIIDVNSALQIYYLSFIFLHNFLHQWVLKLDFINLYPNLCLYFHIHATCVNFSTLIFVPWCF